MTKSTLKHYSWERVGNDKFTAAQLKFPISEQSKTKIYHCLIDIHKKNPKYTLDEIFIYLEKSLKFSRKFSKPLQNYLNNALRDLKDLEKQEMLPKIFQ